MRHFIAQHKKMSVLVAVVVLVSLALVFLCVVGLYSLSEKSSIPAAHMVQARTHNSLSSVAKIENSRHVGQKVYRQYCASCHAEAPAIPIDNTPLVNNVVNWDKRRKKGAHVLINHALLGYNNMPAKGGCIECSAKSIKAAVHYMLDQIDKVKTKG